MSDMSQNGNAVIDNSTTSIEGQTSTNPAWMAQLPEDLKSNEGLTKFGTIGDLGKSYLELQGKLGNSVTIPADTATQEEKERFYKKIGRPNSADKYSLSKTKLPDGMKPDEEYEAKFRKSAHEAGLSNSQASKLYETFETAMVDKYNNLLNQGKEARSKAIETLKGEWGNDYNANLKHAKDAILHFGGEELLKTFNKVGLSNNPELAKAFLKIKQSISEDVFETGEGKKPTPTRPGLLQYKDM